MTAISHKPLSVSSLYQIRRYALEQERIEELDKKRLSYLEEKDDLIKKIRFGIARGPMRGPEE